ncbi:MAG: glycosyltransferase family 2 protein [Ignavibacteriales bacterium]|nr:MAG: glycosyltransferase family 2 protein [Ignavibacteriales bacterium]
MNSTSKKNKICAVIPFYNEAETIHSISVETLNYVDQLILVNDGSTDQSLKNIPDDDRIIIINSTSNNGKGSALKIGFLKSLELGFEYTVSLDADFQHEPKWIPSLTDALKNYDIVIGNRLNDISSMPIQRIASNKLTSMLLSLKTGTRIIDSQCGFRAFRTKVLQNILPSYNGYEAESEMLILAARQKLKVGSVNISTIYGNEKSKIKPVKTILGFVRVLFI